MHFYLGTHEVSWLRRVTDVPLFISHRRLQRQKALPEATTRWALDSGGFTELSTHGRWMASPEEYVDAVWRYTTEVGMLDWVAPQDWMCEPWIVAKTGLSVREHQDRTVANYLRLRELAPDLPFVPVLQGWSFGDYLDCIQVYDRAQVDLSAAPVVGLGSVCRRQHTSDIQRLIEQLAGMGLKLHGFGVKVLGMQRYGPLLTSADSMSWSFRARRGQIRLKGCTHARCQNCLRWALQWRDELLKGIDRRTV